MKKFFLTAALVAAVASPALAASSHNVRNSAATQDAQGTYAAAEDSYAQGSDAYARPDADTVVADGKIIGRDPDAFIRQSLLREGDHNDQNGY